MLNAGFVGYAPQFMEGTMSTDLGFTFKKRKGEYQIFQNGKKAMTLRGHRASKFHDEVAFGNFNSQQQTMARLTGNYKHGNERVAKYHPRNCR